MGRIKILCLGLLIGGLYCQAIAQTAVNFRVVAAHEIERRAELHLLKYVDWSLEYSITNNSKKDLIVFGRDLGNGVIDPVRYVLIYDKEVKTWNYPNPQNAPISWKLVSGAEKHRLILRPGQSLSFVREVSREQDCGRKMIVTAQVSNTGTKETREIRSDEYRVPCLNSVTGMEVGTHMRTFSSSNPEHR